MAKLPVWLVLACGLSLYCTPATAADKRCTVDLKIDRVYLKHRRYPTVLATVSHDCPYSFSFVRIACTFLHKDKPVTVKEGLVTNVASGIPASRELTALSFDRVGFDSARCRIASTTR